MLSLVLVSLHHECGYLCLGSLFQVWQLLQDLNTQDDSVAYDRSDHLLFLHHRGIPRRCLHFRLHVPLAQAPPQA